MGLICSMDLKTLGLVFCLRHSSWFCIFLLLVKFLEMWSTDIVQEPGLHLYFISSYSDRWNLWQFFSPWSLKTPVRQSRFSRSDNRTNFYIFFYTLRVSSLLWEFHIRKYISEFHFKELFQFFFNEHLVSFTNSLIHVSHANVENACSTLYILLCDHGWALLIGK